MKKLSTRFWTAFGSYSNGVITEKSYFVDNHIEEISLDETFDPSIGREIIYNKFGTMNTKLSQHLLFLKDLQYKQKQPIKSQ